MEIREEISIRDLLEAGSHWGHQTSRWNPKMKRFIFEESNGLYVIDLAKTMQQLREAAEAVKEVVESGKSILIVGTKKQAKEIVREIAEKCGELYVNERWLGGTLTNLPTIRNSVKKLDRIEKKISTGGEGMTKKEMVLLSKQQTKLDKNLAGVRAMRKLPGLVIVVDPTREHIAVAEANKLGIPVMGLVDTNCDPDPIRYVIAANDDALKSIKLILEFLAGAILKKKGELRIASGREEESSLQPEEEKSPESEEG